MGFIFRSINGFLWFAVLVIMGLARTGRAFFFVRDEIVLVGEGGGGYLTAGLEAVDIYLEW